MGTEHYSWRDTYRGMSSDNIKGLVLALSSSVFIGASFIIKKKGLKKSGVSGVRAGSKLDTLLLIFKGSENFIHLSRLFIQGGYIVCVCVGMWFLCECLLVCLNEGDLVVFSTFICFRTDTSSQFQGTWI